MTTSRLRRTLAVLAAVLATFPAAATAQGDAGSSTLRVVIRAHQGGAPVSGARVELLGARRAANTDAAGVASLAAVPAGPAIVSVHKFGYGDERFALNVPAGDTVTVEVDLQAEAVRLAEIRATAVRSRVLVESGFLDRQRQGIGTFATRADWRGRGRLQFTDVVRRMRGVRVARTEEGNTVLVASRGSISMSSMCSGVLLFVDGVPVMSDGRYDDVNNLVPLDELEAIETYAGPSEIPPQYNRTNSACAVVVAWRRGAG
jgi:hypothetical protein